MTIKYLLFSLCFITLTLQGQTKLIPGMIIKQDNDTVYGNIEFKNNIAIGTTCRFQLKGDTLFTEYTANDIKGFQFIQGKTYESKLLPDGSTVFLERIGKKAPRIYFRHELKGYHYYLENSKSELKEIPYYVHKYPVKGKLVLIHSNQNYGFSNTLDIDDQNPEGLPFRKAYNLEITGGMIFNQQTSLSDDVFQLNAMVNMCNPYVKGNFYFRTGIQFLDITSHRDDMIFRIPLQVEFQTYTDVINARFAAGVNIYRPFYLTACIMGGLDIRISKTFGWTITYDVDYDQIKFPFNAPFVNSLSTGFVIGL